VRRRKGNLGDDLAMAIHAERSHSTCAANDLEESNADRSDFRGMWPPSCGTLCAAGTGAMLECEGDAKSCIDDHRCRLHKRGDFLHLAACFGAIRLLDG